MGKIGQRLVEDVSNVLLLQVNLGRFGGGQLPSYVSPSKNVVRTFKFLQKSIAHGISIQKNVVTKGVTFFDLIESCQTVCDICIYIVSN